MAGYYQRRVSSAAAWSVRLAAFAAMLFAVAGLGHRYRLVETAPFLWVLGIVGFAAAIAFVCAVFGFFDLWERGDKAGRKALRGGLLALLVLAPFLHGGWKAATLPNLHDVATDTVDPPRFRFLLSSRPAGANPVEPISAEDSQRILRAYPQVNGRRYEAGPEAVLSAIRDLVSLRGWQIVAQRGTAGNDADITVEAAGFSSILRYPADIAIRIADEGVSTYVDMRSASRFGRHDLGDNAARIVGFLADLDRAIANLAGQIAEPADAQPAEE